MNDSASEQAGGVDLRRSKTWRATSVDGIDRLPPHSPEAEQGVIGCCLLAPQETIGSVCERIKHPDTFYDLRNGTIWTALREMYDARQAVDVITVQQRLKDRNLLDQVGGIPYLNAVQDFVPSAANLSAYLDVLIEKHQLRRLVQAGTNLACRVYDHTGTVETLLDEVERDVMALREGHAEGSQTSKALVRRAIDRLDEAHARQGAMGGIATGFDKFDSLTDGMHGGEMIVIAARPSIGKTTLALNISEHVALHLKLPVGVFSLEMQAEQLMLRSLAAQARVNLRDVRAGFLKESDYPKLVSASVRLSDAPLHIDDTPGLSIMQLRARARRMVQQHGIKLFVVDYLQLLHSTTPRAADNRQQEIADISSGIKSLAKELNLPIVVLSQLNREIEKDKARKPRLSDLRESGAIEQDADLVGLLYKPGKTEAETEDESDAIPVNLLIAKQRNGPCGNVYLTFVKSQTRFETRFEAPEPEDDNPRNPHAD